MLIVMIMMVIMMIIVMIDGVVMIMIIVMIIVMIEGVVLFPCMAHSKTIIPKTVNYPAYPQQVYLHFQPWKITLLKCCPRVERTPNEIIRRKVNFRIKLVIDGLA